MDWALSRAQAPGKKSAAKTRTLFTRRVDFIIQNTRGGRGRAVEEARKRKATGGRPLEKKEEEATIKNKGGVFLGM